MKGTRKLTHHHQPYHPEHCFVMPFSKVKRWKNPSGLKSGWWLGDLGCHSVQHAFEKVWIILNLDIITRGTGLFRGPIAQHFNYDQVALAAQRPVVYRCAELQLLCFYFLWRCGIIWCPAAMEMEGIKIANMSVIATTWSQFQQRHHHKEVCLKMFQRISSEASHCVAF